MLESIQIFIELGSENVRIHDLIENLAAHNHDTIEFTVHVENKSLCLRLLNNNQTSVYDGAMSVEHFAESVSRILTRRNLKYSIIEHLNIEDLQSETSQDIGQ